MGKLLDENSLRAIRTFVRTSIATAISTVYKPQGSNSVSGLNGLTKVEAMNGYVYDVTNSGNLIQSNGSTIHVNQGENTVFIWNNGNWYWDVLGGIVDLSNLVPKNSNAQSLTGAVKVNVDENGLVIGSSALLASDIPDLSATYIPVTDKSSANGVASLDANVKIKLTEMNQLASYIDQDAVKIVRKNNGDWELKNSDDETIRTIYNRKLKIFDSSNLIWTMISSSQAGITYNIDNKKLLSSTILIDAEYVLLQSDKEQSNNNYATEFYLILVSDLAEYFSNKMLVSLKDNIYLVTNEKSHVGLDIPCHIFKLLTKLSAPLSYNKGLFNCFYVDPNETIAHVKELVSQNISHGTTYANFYTYDNVYKKWVNSNDELVSTTKYDDLNYIHSYLGSNNFDIDISQYLYNTRGYILCKARDSSIPCYYIVYLSSWGEWPGFNIQDYNGSDGLISQGSLFIIDGYPDRIYRCNHFKTIKGYLPEASTSQSGIITTGVQTFAGNKTFANVVCFNNGLTDGTNTITVAQMVAKVTGNAAITGATKCKITYDSKGLVTAGADLAASDIPDLSATYATLDTDQTINSTKTIGIGKHILITNEGGHGYHYGYIGTDYQTGYNRGISIGTKIDITGTALGIGMSCISVYKDTACFIFQYYDPNVPGSHLGNARAYIRKRSSDNKVEVDIGNGYLTDGTYSLTIAQLNAKVTGNTAITGATKCKITYDSKGLVTAGADLAASDIPNLAASKITSGTFADARIASASTWNAKYDKPSGGIPASDLAESYVKTNALVAGATKCKITYDSKGLVTAGADLTASDIPNLSSTYLNVNGISSNPTLAQTNQIRRKYLRLISSYNITHNHDFQNNPSDYLSGWKYYSGVTYGECFYLSEPFKGKNEQQSGYAIAIGSSGFTLDTCHNGDLDDQSSLIAHISSEIVYFSISHYTLRLNATDGLTLNNTPILLANTAITGATKCKITYDSKGLVTAGADLAASDIPNLDASKITSGTFADARIASASTWNAKYAKPSGGIPASDLAESYILSSDKGSANGVASLGSDGKVPTSQLPIIGNPTSFSWTNGTSSGPTGTLVVDGANNVSFPAIPSASETVSGIITTGHQKFSGNKSFSDIVGFHSINVDIENNNENFLIIVDTSTGKNNTFLTIDDENNAVFSYWVTETLTADRTYTFPDKTGTIALLEDLPQILDYRS